ncbi:MAG TPA: rhomboid family intramembrane serine protease [Thermoanaerobaculia bacterium]|jgi:rhomboid protease GluP|nr:rhomboid family intramembrane serine protease [Thermoanaerobaculia bacterium]
MAKRTGSILCPSCGRLVGVNDDVCLNCGRRKPGMWGLTQVLGRLGRDAGFVQVVIGGCVFLYLAMLAVDPQNIQTNGIFNFGGPSREALFRFGSSGGSPVLVHGRWWTLLSAGWLHAGLLHIGFNLYWVRILAPETAELYGAARMVILYTLSSIAGFLLSSVTAFLPIPLLHGGVLTVGASAPILGLLGAMVWYGRRAGSRHIGGQAWSYAIFMIAFGFLMPGIDNMAHIGGFAGGYLGGMLLDPMKPERGNHQALALVCLLATAAAVITSLVVPIR